MNRKRKSDPKIDEVEDGARATNLEEALTSLVFEPDRHVGFVAGERYLPFELLKLAGTYETRTLEVHEATYDLWNTTILTGYDVGGSFESAKVAS